MLTTALLGLASSVATEVVKWLNKKLVRTPLQGDAALLLSVVLALLAGLVRVALVDVPFGHVWSVESFLALSATAFGVSQLYFRTIAKWLDLKVSSPSQ